MNIPRASRLSRPPQTSVVWLGRYLPSGSLQRKLFFGLFVPVVCLLLLGLIADKIVMPIITRQGSEFPLPDFTTQRLLEAQISLNELELTHEVSAEDFSPGVPAGVILQQFPKANSKVKPGRKIKFVVSAGQKIIPIPELSGKSVRQAMLDLETYGLKLGDIQWALSDTLPERVVVFSYPAAGFEVPMGSLVNLMVNRGRASNFTYMPSVVGLTIDEALKRLEDKGLKLGVQTTRTDENYLPETVLEQSESEGTELDVDTEIDLVISTIE
ncbi:MAG: PASTA domain-containing protein [candidate division Zixibacteria bacterium]|nr:PASTA domain-containing protein [candidate division Zixibacteria bacterium]